MGSADSFLFLWLSFTKINSRLTRSSFKPAWEQRTLKIALKVFFTKNSCSIFDLRVWLFYLVIIAEEGHRHEAAQVGDWHVGVLLLTSVQQGVHLMCFLFLGTFCQNVICLSNTLNVLRASFVLDILFFMNVNVLKSKTISNMRNFKDCNNNNI